MRTHSGALALAIAVIMSLLAVVIAQAGAVNPADTYTQPSNSTAYGTIDPDNLEINSGGLGTCDASRTTYLRWDLSGVNQPAGDITSLTLFVNNAQSSNTGQVALYKVTDDTWDEATLTGNTPPPALGAQITSVSIPTATGGTISFSGAALAGWVNENTSYVGGSDTTVGNDKISFAIQVTGCSGFSNPVRFDSKDKVGGVAPVLLLFSPNAITLSTFHAADPLVNWLLYGGLGLLGLVAVVGTVVYRQRAVAR